MNGNQYTYDQDSNVTARINAVNSSFNESYSYDALNRLTSFSQGSSHTQSWSLDAEGNWSSVTTDGTTQTRGTNAQNEYTSVSGGTTPTYDSNGNLTTDPNGNTYVYDAWNRLVAVKSGSTTLVAYGYDALNRRITETSSGTTTDLYYSIGWHVVEERVGGTATFQYIWSATGGDTLVLRDKLNSNGTLNQRLWVQQDANGNVTALTSNSGAVLERYAYDPYGTVSIYDASWSTRSSSSYGWQYLFQGLRLDVTAGLYDERMRVYSAALGRALQLDPIGFADGYTNGYLFVGDQPIDATDRSGLQQDHHIFPKAHWQSGRVNIIANFSPEAQKVFDRALLNGLYHKNWSKLHSAYNAAARVEAQAWLAANPKINPAAMTTQEAEALLNAIQNSSRPEIKGFLNFIQTGRFGSANIKALLGIAGLVLTAAELSEVVKTGTHRFVGEKIIDEIAEDGSRTVVYKCKIMKATGLFGLGEPEYEGDVLIVHRFAKSSPDISTAAPNTLSQLITLTESPMINDMLTNRGITETILKVGDLRPPSSTVDLKRQAPDGASYDGSRIYRAMP